VTGNCIPCGESASYPFTVVVILAGIGAALGLIYYPFRERIRAYFRYDPKNFSLLAQGEPSRRPNISRLTRATRRE
jgi:hypothetical protein